MVDGDADISQTVDRLLPRVRARRDAMQEQHGRASFIPAVCERRLRSVAGRYSLLRRPVRPTHRLAVADCSGQRVPLTWKKFIKKSQVPLSMAWTALLVMPCVVVR